MPGKGRNSGTVAIQLWGDGGADGAPDSRTSGAARSTRASVRCSRHTTAFQEGNPAPRVAEPARGGRSRWSAPATSSPTRARSARRSPAPTSAAAGSRRPAAEFERAVEIDPVNDYAHFGLGLCLLRRGDRLGARRHLKLAVAMRPDQPDYRDALAARRRRRVTDRERTVSAPGRLPATSTAWSGAATSRSRPRPTAIARAARRRAAGRRSCRTTRARRSATSWPSSSASGVARRRPTTCSPARSRRRGCSRSRCAPGARVLVCAGPGCVEALAGVGLGRGRRRPGRRGGRRLPPRLRLRRARPGVARGARRAPASSPPTSTPPTRSRAG